MNRRCVLALLPLAALPWTSGCVKRFTLPTGYVQAPYFGYDVRGVSAQGHAIGLRTHDNTNPPAGLDFWTQAVEHQKVDIEGMKLAGRESIRSDVGVEGTLFKFELGEGQSKTAYWVALFVQDRRITTVEAALPDSAVGKEGPAILKSMQSVQ